jgi:hypothetical protein
MEWQPIPKWVEFLIRFGFCWPRNISEPRRIAFISMPCDSAAAGLVALGALIKDFGNSDTNDMDGLYDSLLLYAKQYIDYCSKCSSRCNPQKAACGYACEAKGWLRRITVKENKKYRISKEKTNIEKRELWLEKKSCAWYRSPKYISEWHVDGEPIPEVICGEGVLSWEPYKDLVTGSIPIAENLGRSYSGLCFSGRVGGEKVTRDICSALRFRNNTLEVRLQDLLTIHEWSEFSPISRMIYFNSLTGRFDRHASLLNLVIVDGESSYFKVCDRPEFQRSDIICVIHRIKNRSELEDIGNRIAGLRQWYDEDSSIVNRLPEKPRGISILSLKKRKS